MGEWIEIETYSQFETRQDLHVCDFYKNKVNGYYVDLGANDGFDLSNTYLLEKNYGWKGICVEPVPNKFNDLKSLRKNSICINKAVCNIPNSTATFNIPECSLLAGIVEHIDKHQETLNVEHQVTVETITLYDLLRENNAPAMIDYLSLDTEGSEFEILKSNNYDEYNFGLIHLEHNYIEPKRTQIRNFLLDRGYIHMNENMWDDEYIHKSLEHLIRG
jgi:FkbM family methyltransferase